MGLSIIMMKKCKVKETLSWEFKQKFLMNLNMLLSQNKSRYRQQKQNKSQCRQQKQNKSQYRHLNKNKHQNQNR